MNQLIKITFTQPAITCPKQSPLEQIELEFPRSPKPFLLYEPSYAWPQSMSWVVVLSAAFFLAVKGFRCVLLSREASLSSLRGLRLRRELSQELSRLQAS